MMVRLAEQEEIEAVMAFYGDVIDALKDSDIPLGWKKGVYPTREMVRRAAGQKELYLAFESEEIAGALILNREFNEGYLQVPWKTEAEPDKVSVIHAFAVSPGYRGRGTGRRLLAAVCKERRNRGDHAIRLDVLTQNVPAVRLYESAGFQLADVRKLYYEPIGTQEFCLYEYGLRK